MLEKLVLKTCGDKEALRLVMMARLKQLFNGERPVAVSMGTSNDETPNNIVENCVGEKIAKRTVPSFAPPAAAVSERVQPNLCFVAPHVPFTGAQLPNEPLSLRNLRSSLPKSVTALKMPPKMSSTRLAASTEEAFNNIVERHVAEKSPRSTVLSFAPRPAPPVTELPQPNLCFLAPPLSLTGVHTTQIQ
jgi:hypothetical protein